MSLTGVLLADFSAFRREAELSTQSLKQMQSGADTAAAQLSTMGSGINIQNAITNPMGAATEAVSGFTESLVAGGTVLGLSAVAAGALGVVMFGLAEHSAEAIAKFDNLADSTGMSVPALSRLSNAAAAVGADFHTLTGVVADLEKAIGKNSTAFQHGLAEMGLSTSTLRSVGPDRYLEVIIDGLNSIEDPAKRAAAGAQVLAGRYKEVAGSLKDLKEGYDLTRDIDPFTAEQAANAERFLNQLGSIKVHLEALAIAFGTPLITPISKFIDALGWLSDKYNSMPDALKMIATPANAMKFALSEAGAAVDYFVGSAAKLPATTAPAAQGMDALKESAKALLLYVPTLKDATAATKEVDAAQKSWEKAISAVADAMAGWQTVLKTIPPDVAAMATAALLAGASQGDVATAYKLSAAQVKALTIELEDNTKAIQINADFAEDAAKRRAEITRITTQQTNDAILAKLKEQQANDAFYSTTLEQAKKLDAETLAAQASIQQAQKETTNVTQAELDKRLVAAQSNTRALLADAKSTQYQLDAAVTQSSEAFYQANLRVKADFSETSKHISDEFTVSFDKSAQAFNEFVSIVVGGSNQMLAGIIAVTDAGTWAEQQRQMYENQQASGRFFQQLGGAPPPVVKGLPMQTRDSGGPVSAGTPYLIGGGKEPEIFVPGASGFVTPGGGSGIQVTNVFHIVDTEANITRRVSANITRSIMAAQKL